MVGSEQFKAESTAYCGNTAIGEADAVGRISSKLIYSGPETVAWHYTSGYAIRAILKDGALHSAAHYRKHQMRITGDHSQTWFTTRPEREGYGEYGITQPHHRWKLDQSPTYRVGVNVSAVHWDNVFKPLWHYPKGDVMWFGVSAPVPIEKWCAFEQFVKNTSLEAGFTGTKGEWVGVPDMAAFRERIHDLRTGDMANGTDSFQVENFAGFKNFDVREYVLACATKLRLLMSPVWLNLLAETWEEIVESRTDAQERRLSVLFLDEIDAAFAPEPTNDFNRAIVQSAGRVSVLQAQVTRYGRLNRYRSVSWVVE